MGILSTILLAPLTMPMRSTLWISRKLAETAAAERDDPAALRVLLKEAERELLAGQLSEEDYDRIETDILTRLKVGT
jgi:hypothetical protein